MHNKKVLWILFPVTILAVAILGVFVYQPAEAAAPTVNVDPHRGPGRGGITNEALASALGITTDELAAAYEQATNAALDQAVADGLLTQAQADAVRERGAGKSFGGLWGGWLSQGGLEYQAFLADALGISVDELNAAYTQAYNTQIDRAVTDGRLTQEQADLAKGQRALFSSQAFRSAMQSAFESAVQAAVDNGVITQAQADQILQNMGDGGEGGSFGGRGKFGPGFGGHGPGLHGDMGGEAPAQPAPDSTYPAPDAQDAPAATPSGTL